MRNTWAGSQLGRARGVDLHLFEVDAASRQVPRHQQQGPHGVRIGIDLAQHDVLRVIDSPRSSASSSRVIASPLSSTRFRSTSSDPVKTQ